MWDALAAQCATAGHTVTRDTLPGSENGRTQWDQHAVTARGDVEDAQAVKTLLFLRLPGRMAHSTGDVDTALTDTGTRVPATAHTVLDAVRAHLDPPAAVLDQLAVRAGAARAEALRRSGTPDRAVVDRGRLVAANTAAQRFFTDHYRSSWAPAYLRQRLGGTVDPTFVQAGHAPPGWMALTEHLRRAGFTDTEILDAGLGATASTGRDIDRFRDRLTFPIRNHEGELVGFVGRRNHTHDTAADSLDPKYLNSATTAIYDKSRVLFGLSDARTALDEGGPIVLVEGPIDTVAVPHASAGTMAGVAALGTAVTEHHVAALRTALGARTSGIVVATDAYHAGHHAAATAHARLGGAGLDPCGAALPHGLDPTDVAVRYGPAALFDDLDTTEPLTRQIVDYTLADRTLDTPEQRVAAARATAAIITRPPRAPGTTPLTPCPQDSAWTSDCCAARSPTWSRETPLRWSDPRCSITTETLVAACRH